VLSPANPATIFISYSRADEANIIPVERAMQERGIRVLRDKPSLPSGAPNIEGLIQMIDQECDAILFYVTDTLLNSGFIRTYEIPTADERHKREPSFHIIPIVQGMSWSQLSDRCNDLGIPSLSRFNGTCLFGNQPSAPEVREIAQKALHATLTLRLARAENEDVLSFCLRTFPYVPPATSLHLDIDWTTAFTGRGPTLDTWATELLPALGDVADELARSGRPHVAEAWLKARLPAGIALGHAFPPKGSKRLRLRNEDAVWECDGPGEALDNLDFSTPHPYERGNSAIVEVAISRDTTPSVTRWLQSVDPLQSWKRLLCTPTEGPSRAALATDAQARAWSRAIGDKLRQLWDSEDVDDVHLFVASSIEFAVMVGRQLRDRHPVHIYFGDNEAGYKLAYTLNT
jgi:hypothetical protein